jgi:hypothetical protein
VTGVQTCALPISVGGGVLRRVPDVLEIDEVDAFDQATVLDVQAGDDSSVVHAFSPFVVSIVLDAIRDLSQTQYSRGWRGGREDNLTGAGVTSCRSGDLGSGGRTRRPRRLYIVCPVAGKSVDRAKPSIS